MMHFKNRLAADLPRILSGVAESLYPENLYCISCGDTIEGRTRVHGLCDQCMAAIDWDMADPFAENGEIFAFDRLWRCCVYGWYVRRIMNGLKMRGRSYYARNLGLLLAERVLRGCEEEGLEPESFDTILAVPMAQHKKIHRGYNQAQLLAEYTAAELNLKDKVRDDILIKNQETASMRFSDGRTRRSALAHVFSLCSDSQKIDRFVKEKRILLIDDVSTTGSTGDACSRVLKEAGAADVTFLCFASAQGQMVE